MKTLSTMVIVILNVSCAVFASEPLSPPDSGGWRLIAKSQCILTGRLTVPVEAIQAAVGSGRGQFFSIRVDVAQTLKGESPASPVSIRSYTEPSPFRPSTQSICELNGKEVLLFLSGVAEESAPEYFFTKDPSSLQALSPEALAAVEAEVKAQSDILKRYRAPKKKDNTYRNVRKLIDATTRPEQAADAMIALQSMGKEAVPAMIHLMDDRRPLAVKEVVIAGPPGGWEGVHQSPQTVVDALSIFLGGKTGESLSSIYNGGSERARAAAVDAWRIYLHHLEAD